MTKKVLFALAACNCGSDRAKQLRAEAVAKGLNPNVRINNVEVIAAARVGAEPVNYVSNIYRQSNKSGAEEPESPLREIRHEGALP